MTKEQTRYGSVRYKGSKKELSVLNKKREDNTPAEELAVGEFTQHYSIGDMSPTSTDSEEYIASRYMMYEIYRILGGFMYVFYGDLESGNTVCSSFVPYAPSTIMYQNEGGR